MLFLSANGEMSHDNDDDDGGGGGRVDELAGRSKKSNLCSSVCVCVLVWRLGYRYDIHEVITFMLRLPLRRFGFFNMRIRDNLKLFEWV